MPNTCENYEKKCGGCPLLTLPYPEQVAKKQARVSTLLGHYAPVEPLRAMQAGYKMRFAETEYENISVDYPRHLDEVIAEIRRLGLDKTIEG